LLVLGRLFVRFDLILFPLLGDVLLFHNAEDIARLIVVLDQSPSSFFAISKN
jgi:hypothetical protein